MRIVNLAPENLRQLPSSGCAGCAYWHGGIAEDPVETKGQMIRRGQLKGKVAMDEDGAAMGYIQYGPMETYPEYVKLRQGFGAEEITSAWVITCIMTGKDYRGRGVAKSLLQAVLEEAQSQGRTLEAIGMEEANLEVISTGPATIYRQAGFEESGRFRDKYGVNVLLCTRPIQEGV